ncbi:MAG: EF2563 family selenium-dependent molybdenum hydroxylase system protein [Lachnospiraceae bacterium]|nr:EF2563 family selenium-dependent molybdenum hydroxylase system protein [Lachnospiraceae bacterium]
MKILIKGAGDLATGIAWMLKKAGYDLLMTDLEVPTAVRRTVSFSRAVYEGTATVEGITARAAYDIEQIYETINRDEIPVIADPKAEISGSFSPDIVVDAIIAKKNTGTRIDDAGLVIGVGPGFTAGMDCHCVIETKRGHYLGRVIREGSAAPNTGIPGDIGGYTSERIIRAAADGIFKPCRFIGDQVSKGDLLATSGGVPVYASISGIIRGMLQEGVPVSLNMKCGDIDPRCEAAHCLTISDKARSIGGGVLEAVTSYRYRLERTAFVLLASGKGERFGANKLLHVYNGRRLFAYAVDAAPGYLERTVVTGYDEIADYAAQKGFNIVRNPEPELGISHSIHLGLASLTSAQTLQPPSAVVFSVCDQPGLTVQSIDRLIHSYAAGDKGLACLCSPGADPGNPCLFSRKYFHDLMSLEGDIGGKRIILEHQDDLIRVTADSRELTDIDYREQI